MMAYVEAVFVGSCGAVLVVLAYLGYKEDRLRGRKPLWLLHIFNLVVGIMALAWAVYDISM